MLKLKIINQSKMIKMKCNIEFPDVILANLQEKEVFPTKEKQEVVADSQYDGLSKVTVDKIPDEYIIPTGNIEITKNGIYNVREKETANVNIPVLKLGTKNITENGVYKASDDELDGYSEVTVGIKSLFTGHYDRQGLKQIGWTDEEINYYNQNGVQWNASEDEYFKLTTEELAGDDSKNTRFIPKNSTKTGFNGYHKLLAIPLLNTSSVTNMDRMFSSCYSLTTIPQLNTSSVTSMNNMFSSCSSLTTIPLLDTNKVTSMNTMFSYCYSLTTIPQLETSNVTNMSYMFQNCYSLTTIPELNTSKVTNTSYMFYNCSSLTTLGGLENLGQAYSTTSSANNSSYKLDLSSCKKLTEQSLINVLTNLYDIKTKGCKAQQVVLGSTNLAKLVSEEGQQALSNAQAKGWTVS